MRRLRTSAAAWMVAAVIASGCAGAQLENAVNRAITVTNTARDQFLDWDRQHQIAIVESIADPETARAELAAYRQKREAVVKAFVAAYTALAGATTLLPLVEKGVEPEAKLMGLLAEGAGAIQTAITAIAAIRGDGE